MLKFISGFRKTRALRIAQVVCCAKVAPMDLDLTYPEVADLRRRARRRLPRFAFDYLDSGTGAELGMSRNRAALDAVQLMPAILGGEFEAELETEFMGTRYGLPVGVAPIGMSGMIWPGAERMLAACAAEVRIPYCLSTVATKLPEAIGPISGDMGWFQMYPPRDREIRRDMMKRARAAGFTKLILTVDVPGDSRRERQRRAHVALPPRITPLVAWEIVKHPGWAVRTAIEGRPSVVLPESYLTKEQLSSDSFMHAGRVIRGFPDWAMLDSVREDWDGDLLVKGVMVPDDAKRLVKVGVDGLWVSNHSARQLDAAPATIEQLPKVRAAVGDAVPIIFDSGVLGGLDILRALALGADFVMMGRAWHYALGALGARGPKWLTHIIEQDLRANMAQIGVQRFSDLPRQLVRD